MAKKTTRKIETDSRNKIAAALLKLVARQPWASITLADIAQAAKMPEAQLKKNFADKNDILIFIIEDHDRHMLDSLKQAGPATPVHEILFDALMARFDSLQKTRASFLNLFSESICDPQLARVITCHLQKSLRSVVRHIAPTAAAPKHGLATLALLVIYISVLCVWRRDESADMARTMAILDRALKRSAKLGEIFLHAI